MRGCVCVCMRPPKHDECSGAQTGQGAFAYTGSMQDAQAVGVFAGAVDNTREETLDPKIEMTT